MSFDPTETNLDSLKTILAQSNNPAIEQARELSQGNLAELPLQERLAKYPKIQVLPFSGTVYFPSAYTKQVEILAGKMSRRYGGATTSQHHGYWENQDGQIVSESITLIKSFMTGEQLIRTFDELLEIVAYLGSECDQEAMAIELGSFSNSLMLILPT